MAVAVSCAQRGDMTICADNYLKYNFLQLNIF